jgi:hypothetical protein
VLQQCDEKYGRSGMSTLIKLVGKTSGLPHGMQASDCLVPNQECLCVARLWWS